MLVHSGTQTLRTQRLTLRQFKLPDAEAMFRNWASDPEVTRFLSWPPHKNIDITEGTIAAWVSVYDNPHIYNWAIVPDEAAEVIGSISAYDLDDRNERAEIGYCMSKKYWNRGVMTEAMGAVLSYLIAQVGFNRIQAKHDTKNPASGRVMVKSGMTCEGMMRQYKRNADGTYSDMMLYSITKEEFIQAGKFMRAQVRV